LNFRGDNARVFQRVSMNLNMTVGQAACQLLSRYAQNTLAASCVCWIVPIVTCDSIKRTCGCSCLNASDQWHNWRLAGVTVTDRWHQWHNWVEYQAKVTLPTGNRRIFPNDTRKQQKKWQKRVWVECLRLVVLGLSNQAKPLQGQVDGATCK